MQGWIKLTTSLGDNDVWFQISHIERVTTSAGHTQIGQRGQNTAVKQSIEDVMQLISRAT
jgi:hypothetical protein